MLRLPKVSFRLTRSDNDVVVSGGHAEGNGSGVSAIVSYVEYVGGNGGFMSGVSTLESND